MLRRKVVVPSALRKECLFEAAPSEHIAQGAAYDTYNCADC